MILRFRKLYRGGGYKSMDDRFLIWPRLDRGWKAIDMAGDADVLIRAVTFREAVAWCESKLTA
jgi:hypothetical protein